MLARHSRSLLLSSLIALLAPATLADETAAPPTISFEEQAVVVEGLAAGADTILFGAGRGVAGFLPYQTRFSERRTADAEGTARFELAQPLPTSSVWVVVDLAAGGATLAAPEGSELREVHFPGRGLPASLERLEDARSGLEVLWVRPLGTAPEPAEGAGAWGGRVRDGSGRDGDDREDRRLSVRLDLLDAIGASPPAPARLTAGDVLVGIDTETLEIYTFRLRS
jgi:hypothetical protein